MPMSGAISATSAGGTARTGRGSSASLDTINYDLRGLPPITRAPGRYFAWEM
jgi:hypothetical protein